MGKYPKLGPYWTRRSQNRRRAFRRPPAAASSANHVCVAAEQSSVAVSRHVLVCSCLQVVFADCVSLFAEGSVVRCWQLHHWTTRTSQVSSVLVTLVSHSFSVPFVVVHVVSDTPPNQVHSNFFSFCCNREMNKVTCTFTFGLGLFGRNYSGFHFLCSKLWTVADASSFALKLCRMLEKICRGVPSSPFSKRIRKGSSFRPLSSFPPFAGATLGCYNVTNPQFSVDLLACQAAPMGYTSVSSGWVYSRVALSVWPLAVIQLAFTDKIRLTGREMLLCFCWLLFQWPMAVKQANFGSAKNFYCRAYAKLVCYAVARFLAAWWKFVCRTRLRPIFPKHFVLFVWFYLQGLV